LAATLTKKAWVMPKILDQDWKKPTPHCVGFAWDGWGICEPIFDNWDNQKGDDIYYACKVIDGEPGAEDGSFTESGAKVMQSYGRLKDYAFATTWDDMVVWLLTMGPLVVGTNWYTDMMQPDADGVVHVGGYFVGGHDWLVRGIDVDIEKALGAQSWDDWGPFHGFFSMSFEDMIGLQKDNGDACTAAELPLVPEPPTPPPQPDGCRKLIERTFRLGRG
jgi:hypothetical protein